MTTRPRPEIVYRFDGFLLEPAQQRLSDADKHPIALTPKAFDTLLCLVERSGELVTKQELLERVWPNVVVEEAILARNVADLRKALGDDSTTPRFIETLPKRGYRFVAVVTTGTYDQTTSGTQAGGPPARTVDTLQLVAESPAQRHGVALVEAPELTGTRISGAKVLGWAVAALLCAGVVVWIYWRGT